MSLNIPGSELPPNVQSQSATPEYPLRCDYQESHIYWERQPENSVRLWDFTLFTLPLIKSIL
jgi:hypothetical protein